MVRSLMMALVLVVAGVGLAGVGVAWGQGPVVRGVPGDVAGVEAGGVRAFKGIPYAQPPVGALRWRPPVAAAAWPGVRDATQFGNDCMQKPREGSRGSGISEDCLTLNVWAPSGAAGLPVMVWVYGGGFVDGTASLPIYDGAALARRGVVLVSLNYRTGVFGFLAHRGLAAESPAHSAGNYGLLDVVEALRWVKRNVAAFGGDPGRVTVFGESAGASMLDLLLVSPMSDGLVQQAILESPGAMRPLSTLAQAEAVADVAGPDIGALRAMPAEEVLALNEKIVPAVRRLTAPRALGPIVDGWVVPQTDTAAFASGQMRHVPLIVGGNSDEGRLFTRNWPIRTVEAAHDYAVENFAGSAEAMVLLYGLGKDEVVPPGLAYAFGDTQFNYGVRGLARGMAAVEKRVWRYVFTRAQGGGAVPPTHSEEIDYVFGTLGARRFVPRPAPDAVDRALSDAMMGAWVRFAGTGDPNGAGMPAWPAYVAGTDPYLTFGDRIEAGEGYRTPYLDFVEHFLSGRPAQ